MPVKAANPFFGLALLALSCRAPANSPPAAVLVEARAELEARGRSDQAVRGDLNGGAVAMLTDRVEVKAGRPQIYGTQLSLKNGQLVFDPIADSAGVDRRRRRMGLPPLVEYRRLIDSAFGTAPAKPDF